MGLDDLLTVYNNGIKKTFHGGCLLDQGIQHEQVVLQEGNAAIVGEIIQAYLSRFYSLQVEMLFLPGKNDKA